VSLLRLLAMVALLEAAGGLPYGVIMEMVPVWLKAGGMGNVALGALTLVALPWTLKALWAPFIDRFGTYRGWVWAGCLGCAAVIAVLAEVPWLVPALVVCAFLSATQDVAMDAWMVAVIPPQAQSRAVGVRVAAYRGAMAVAGGGGVILGDRFGWDVGFAVLAGVLVLMAASLPLFPPPPPPQSAPVADWVGELKAWATQPGAGDLFAFCLLYKLGDSAMAPMVKPFWLDSGLSPTEVGTISTTVGAVLISVGAVTGGEVIQRLGLTRATLVLGGAQALSNLGYAVAAGLGGRPAIYAASVVESLTMGLGTAALMTIAMRACGSGQSATRFGILSAVIGLTRTLSGALSGVGAELFGYSGYFFATFVLALPALALAPSVTRRLP
jgi:PAT family beta-lactamase induction signal transducer AmpG